MATGVSWGACGRALAAAVVLGAVVPSTAISQPTLDKGHRILLERGLEIQAASAAGFHGGYFPLRDFRLSGFTSINVGHDRPYNLDWYGTPGEYTAGVVQILDSVSLEPARRAAPHVVSLQYLDEQDLNYITVRDRTRLWFDARRADHAFDNTLLFTNQFGFQVLENNLRDYMADSKPDMLMMDEYLIGSTDPALYANGSPTGVYRAMVKYRKLALAGNDGTGRTPIPYGKYLQAFYLGSDPGSGYGSVRVGYRVSQSDVRLDQFSAWAMGFTFASAFAFDSMKPGYDPLEPLLFDGEGPRPLRTKEFRYIADTNRQSLNLGPTLVRLKSTDIRMLTGPLSNPSHGIPEWDPAADADPYMTALSAHNPGAVLGGERGDVLVGFFEPLPGLGSGDAAHDRYFMVVNGLSGEFALAADAAQVIRLDFDFGGSGINSLQRVSRETGLIEDVPLVSDGGSRYHLEWTLPGGTGDLFRYNRAGVGVVPEPAAVGLGLAGGLLALRRRKRPASGAANRRGPS
jgi:hypothetical protein